MLFSNNELKICLFFMIFSFSIENIMAYTSSKAYRKRGDVREARDSIRNLFDEHAARYVGDQCSPFDPEQVLLDGLGNIGYKHGGVLIIVSTRVVRSRRGDYIHLVREIVHVNGLMVYESDYK